MNRTITLIVSVFFSVIFMAFILTAVPRMLRKAETQVSLVNVKATGLSGQMIVSWETEVETDGIVYYRAGATNLSQRDHQFKKTHRIVVQPVSGRVFYRVESCDIVGKCAASEERNVTVS